jgi:uncharacterized RDD family membrane protein YckC
MENHINKPTGDLIANEVYEAPTNYADFFTRFGAIVIDAILIFVVQLVLMLPFGGIFNREPSGSESIISVIISLIAFLYYPIMESSKHQATFGKKALGLRVTDLHGKPIRFGKAFLRNICKIISGAILLIGYIMAAFTEKKQALHDLIAGTLVLKN